MDDGYSGIITAHPALTHLLRDQVERDRRQAMPEVCTGMGTGVGESK